MALVSRVIVFLIVPGFILYLTSILPVFPGKIGSLGKLGTVQPQVDRATGKVTYVFSCFNQDQPLDLVDFPALRERLMQNSLQEKLTAQWVDRSLVLEGARPRAS